MSYVTMFKLALSSDGTQWQYHLNPASGSEVGCMGKYTGKNLSEHDRIPGLLCFITRPKWRPMLRPIYL